MAFLDKINLKKEEKIVKNAEKTGFAHFTEKGISLLNSLTFAVICDIIDTYSERKWKNYSLLYIFV